MALNTSAAHFAIKIEREYRLEAQLITESILVVALSLLSTWPHVATSTSYCSKLLDHRQHNIYKYNIT